MEVKSLCTYSPYTIEQPFIPQTPVLNQRIIKSDVKMKAHTQRAIYDVAISDCPKITEGTIDETLYGGQLCEINVWSSNSKD